MDSKGYYAILGVSEKAKYTEIRAAYRLLAKKYHPDRNNSDFAEDMIKKLNAAFEVLSNREKRRQYDETTFDNYWSHNEDKEVHHDDGDNNNYNKKPTLETVSSKILPHVLPYLILHLKHLDSSDIFSGYVLLYIFICGQF